MGIFSGLEAILIVFDFSRPGFVVQKEAFIFQVTFPVPYGFASISAS